MSHTAKLTFQEKKGNTLVLVCGKCSRPTTHEIVADVNSYDEVGGGDIQFWDSYLVVQCRGCLTLSFCKESENSDNCHPITGEPIVKRELFPGRIAGRPPLKDGYYLPWELQRVYQEARSALMQGLPVLTGIGIRAIVETVCNERGATGGNLLQKINSLVNLNLITGQEAIILHDLRFMGNEAAHKVKAHSSEELNLAFDVVEHLLNTVYLLAEQTKRLPKQSSPQSSDEEED